MVQLFSDNKPKGLSVIYQKCMSYNQSKIIQSDLITKGLDGF